MFEPLLLLIALFLLGAVVLGPIFAAVALWQVTSLRRRIEEVERRWGPRSPDARAGAFEGEAAQPGAQPTRTPATSPEPAEEIATAELADGPPSETREDARAGWDWEVFLGRSALGWTAVVALLFGVAFFLRYAFENEWIGPRGQLTLGAMGGAVLATLGACYARRGLIVLAQLAISAGLLLLYLTAYASFGFYRVVDQPIGGGFLALIVVAGGVLAVVLNARAIALMTVLGGLLVPLLMATVEDQHVSLFIYLAALFGGATLVAYRRDWPSVALVALLGVHGEFWLWFGEAYHPEKLAAAASFHGALFLLGLAPWAIGFLIRRRRAGWVDLARAVIAAYLAFLAGYVLMGHDYDAWRGTLAVAFAVVYLGLARVSLAQAPQDPRQTMAMLAIAVGFAAIAIPIQADARFVALGWAVEALALWWFAWEIRRRAPLLVMAAILIAIALLRTALFDTPSLPREPFTPIFNGYALPAILVVACLIAGVFVAIHHLQRGGKTLPLPARTLVGLSGVLATVVLLWVLSIETYGYFSAYAALPETPPEIALRWRWFGQLALTALWAVYATAVLMIGFARRRPQLRWTALGVYALTIAKVFLFDMAGLDELYRVGAFIAVAALLAFAARLYQRLEVAARRTESQRWAPFAKHPEDES